MKWLMLLSAVTFLTWAPRLEARERPNCKLTVHTNYSDGKRALAIEEITASSRVECKLIAEKRRLDSVQDEDISNIKVYFAYRRQLAIVPKGE